MGSTVLSKNLNLGTNKSVSLNYTCSVSETTSIKFTIVDKFGNSVSKTISTKFIEPKMILSELVMDGDYPNYFPRLKFKNTYNFDARITVTFGTYRKSDNELSFEEEKFFLLKAGQQITYDHYSVNDKFNYLKILDIKANTGSNYENLSIYNATNY